jgi:purine-binding chemotaxis protein CheW
MTTKVRFQGGVVELRRAFDEAFVRPPAPVVGGTEEILLVRVGGDPYALRSRSMTGLVADKRIVPVPSRRPELLGVAGTRGNLVPVYSLTNLLGYGGPGASCRWVALSGDSTPIGLAFQGFDGFVRVDAKDVYAAEGGQVRRHVREVVHVADAVRPLVDVPSILQSLTLRTGASGSIKEG